MLFESIRRTKRCLIFEEGPLTGGIGAEVSARVMENCFDALKAPVRRIAAADSPIPSAATLEQAVTPTADEIYAAVEKLFG